MGELFGNGGEPIALFAFSALVLGLLIGSFLNVVIYRLPLAMMASWRKECQEFLQSQKDEEQNLSEKDLNIVFPPSHCPSCKADIKPWQNIPIISYILLRGKCANCKTRISPRYPIIELTTGILSAFCIYHFGFNTSGALALILTWSLIALTMIDVDHQLLPDSITLPLLWLGLIINSYAVFTDLQSALFGAVFGYAVLWSVYWLFKIIIGKEGMGFGDFKLLAALGAWMGWQMLPLIVILSSMVGAVIGIAGIIIGGKDKNIPIPFGPYLAIAGWIAFFWGGLLTEAYLQFANIG